jgi:hypothetical protein
MEQCGAQFIADTLPTIAVVGEAEMVISHNRLNSSLSNRRLVAGGSLDIFSGAKNITRI